MLRARALTRQVLALILFLTAASGARTHELRPAIAEISFPDGAYQIAIVVNLEALIAGVGPGHADTDLSPVAIDYNRLRAMPPEALTSEYLAFESGFLEALKISGDGAALERDMISLLVPAVGDVELARDSILTVGGPLPGDVGEVSFGWSGAYGPVVFRTAADENGEGFSAFLIGGEVSAPVEVTRGGGSFFGSVWRWMFGG